jgi:NADPH:quinone reductase-like Zn-dependent oxidoreductase
MRNVILDPPGGLDHLRIFETAIPHNLAPQEILVRIHANSLNYHDYGVVGGLKAISAPRIPLSDGAGVVQAVGSQVTEFAVGDHVVSVFFPEWHDGEPTTDNFSTVPGDGVDGYAREYVVRPATWFTKSPVNYTHVEAATLPTAGLTAWRALVVNGGLKAGDTVLVLGTGGVAIFALQLAKVMGATVIVTSSSDEKLARARELGAAHTINYRKEPQWGEAVKKWTGGKGVDHVIEVGGPGTLEQSIQAVKVGGHIALIGVLTGFSGQVPTAALMAKQITLHGFIVGSRQHQKDFIKALDATKLRPVIDKVFKLESLAEAFRYEGEGKHFGKICVEY